MTNVIQQLKDNEKPFGRMSAEMQKEAREIGKGKDFEVYQFSAGGFVRMTGVTTGAFIGDNTYRLRPDYADEPEIVEHRIYGAEGHRHYVDGAAQVHSLHQAMDHDDFIGFKFEDGCIRTSPIYYQLETHTNDQVMVGVNYVGVEYKVLRATHVLSRRTK